MWLFNPIIFIVKDDYAFQEWGNVIKNLFWCTFNLNNDFISLELITLVRENTKEAKIFDNKDVFETNGKGLEYGASFISV